MASNKIIEAIQDERIRTFSYKKCEVLKVNAKNQKKSLAVIDESIREVKSIRYLEDHNFNVKGDNSDLC